jgi:hypothetical protein
MPLRCSDVKWKLRGTGELNPENDSRNALQPNDLGKQGQTLTAYLQCFDGAQCRYETLPDELAAIIDAWPNLPEPVRSTIALIVASTKRVGSNP